MTKKVRQILWHKRSGKMIAPKYLHPRDGKTGKPSLQDGEPLLPPDPTRRFRSQFEQAIHQAVYKNGGQKE